ncbi:MAG: hypothetical protein JWN22_3501, partial [Nocardioides sp.]|nr:hypothetical protein [Nocardioides sp.]
GKHHSSASDDGVKLPQPEGLTGTGTGVLLSAVVMAAAVPVGGISGVLVKTSTKSGGPANRPFHASSATTSSGLWSTGSRNVRATVTATITPSAIHTGGPV